MCMGGKCMNGCEDCVYYFEETGFCLNGMYSVLSNDSCSNKKHKTDFSPDTPITSEELDFAIELTDCRNANMTISELFEDLRAINEEIFD